MLRVTTKTRQETQTELTGRDADVQQLTQCQHLLDSVAMVSGGRHALLLSQTDAHLLRALLGTYVATLAERLGDLKDE